MTNLNVIIKKQPMLKTFLSFFVFLVASAQSLAATERMSSPDGKVRLEVTTGDTLRMSVFYGDEQIVKSSPLCLQVQQEWLGVRPKVKGVHRSYVNQLLQNVVPIKNAVTRDEAQLLTIRFAGRYSVEFRVYNNGVAYRFVLDRKGQVEVTNELMTLHLPSSLKGHLSQTRGFWTSYEEPYTHVALADYHPQDEMTHLPVLFETEKGTKLLLSESDVRDYPAMFLKSAGNGALTTIFPQAPAAWEPLGDRGFNVTKEQPFIARINGKRSLPWRFLVVGDDQTIAANEMERILGGKCQLTDVSWIKPGKVSWDWWNHWTIWNVDFETGINNQTYKYFIDFAAKYGIEYILLDEGWNKDVRNPYVTRDDIDIRELVAYGRQRGVGVILWLAWLTVENHMELIKHYADMGVKGLKIDFMDHSDQWMVNFYERVAEECAKHKLIVDFHGSFKPAGLEIRYPNVISYEGVRGLENGAGCQPDNTIWLPFIRNAVGGMDFTPGSMASAQPEDNHGSGSLPMGSGTRAYQMAMYVCFESGLQMLADSPTRYMQADDCTRYIASVPTTWDESRVLSAKAGEYYVVARRKGQKWYIGAMTGSRPQQLTISLDFLKGNGLLTGFRDGRNAHRIAVDYQRFQQQVTPTDQLTINLTRNGGWCCVIEY